MTDIALQRRFTRKREDIENRCIYGLEYFCDGTPNKSENENDKPRNICPIYNNCGIRKHSIFEENNNED